MINQVYFSSSIRFFRDEFYKYWGVKPYHDPKAPALFIGAYKEADIATIKNHKGFKALWLTGADMKNIYEVLFIPGLVFRSDSAFKMWLETKTTTLPKLKNVNIPMKSYDRFKPFRLGNKVYCYMGKSMQSKKFRHEIVEKVARLSRFEFIYGLHPNSMEYVHENYYKQCFVSLRLNPFAGGTTANELAYMGRKTIGNRDEPWYLNYFSSKDILNHIESESRKIGTIQPSFVPDNYYNYGEWKDENFWIE